MNNKSIRFKRNVNNFIFPQDDIMHRSLTVWEVLYYNAVLRLPPKSDPKEYEKRVKQVGVIKSISSVF